MSYDDDTKRIIRLHDRIKDLEHKLADTAAFLDRLAERLDLRGDQIAPLPRRGQSAMTAPMQRPAPEKQDAADCRAEAKKLRDET